MACWRLFLGLGQKELADLAGCSVHTIQSVELGELPKTGKPRLKLSEELARRISAETGILMEWLLENDPNMPLIADTHELFTVDDYNERRSLRDMGGPTIAALFTQAILGKTTAMIFFAWMRGIFAGRNADIASWKVGKFLEKLAVDYGYHREVFPMTIRLAGLRQHEIRWKQAGIGVRLAEKYAREYRRPNRFDLGKKRSQHRKEPQKRAARTPPYSLPRDQNSIAVNVGAANGIPEAVVMQASCVHDVARQFLC